MDGDPRLTCDRVFRVFARWAGDAVIARMLELEGGTKRESATALTPAQFRCLDLLTRCTGRPCCIGEVADGLAISDPAATKLIDRLENKGLVARTPHAGDRRVVYVEPSEVALELTARLARRRSTLIGAALDRLSIRRLQMLVRALEDLLIRALDSPEMIERVCLRCGGDHAADCVVNRARIKSLEEKG